MQNFKEKLDSYGNQLLKDPDLKRISIEKVSIVYMLVGISKLYNKENSFKQCKDLLKRALSMAETSQTVSKILHNLAMMNYLEIKYHNNKITEREEKEAENEDLDAKYNKIALAEQIRDKGKGLEVDSEGNMKIK